MTQPRRKLVHTEILPIRWGDMDAMGHVNNTVFFRYYEQSRIDWMLSVAGQTTEDGFGAVVKKTSCTYLRQVNYPATLEVKLFAGKPGRTSFPTYSELWTVGAHPEKVAEGEAVMVWVHRKSAQPHPVPDFLRKLMPA